MAARLAALSAAIILAGVANAFAISLSPDEPNWSEPGLVELVQRARSCKSVQSCEEAVELWCNGYSRADGDGDGIPCENVCKSKSEVDRIREDIGC